MRVRFESVAAWASLTLVLSSAISTTAQDVREIVRRSVDREIAGSGVPQDYTYYSREVRSSLDQQRKAP